MQYSWDEKKNRRNLELHGIAFENAARIFEGPTVERVDDRFAYDKQRVYAVGLVNGLEITVIYADGEAWRAEPHERRYYWQNVEGLSV
jgi:uncharacterized DUF497 family protein